jgi:hypothetical protein
LAHVDRDHEQSGATRKGVFGRAIARLKSAALLERYRVAVVIEPQLSRPLWAWQNWSVIMPHLSAVIAGLSAEAVIRPRQAGANDNWLRFGRLPWSEKSNRTWTMKYLEDPALAGRVHFAATEIWAPSRAVSFDSWRGPEFFCLLDYSEIGATQGFVLALRKDVLPRAADAADETIAAVAGFFVAPRRALFDRTWGEHGRFGSVLVINGLDWTRAEAVMSWADAHPLRQVPSFRWTPSVDGTF